jgi:hypothetical protein
MIKEREQKSRWPKGTCLPLGVYKKANKKEDRFPGLLEKTFAFRCPDSSA